MREHTQGMPALCLNGEPSTRVGTHLKHTVLRDC